MTKLAWLPQPLKRLVRLQRDAMRRIGQRRALKAMAQAGSRKIIIGSSGTRMQGWTPTDQELIDLLVDDSWGAFFSPASIDAILAEHVWEHLSADEGRRAAVTCHRYLKPGGFLRVAVPDGFHPDPAYIRAVKPPADDHKMLYTFSGFRDLFVEAGFDVTLLEYFDEQARFQFNDWNAQDGLIRRSKRFDPRNANGHFGYTSIILDATKPKN